MLVKYCGRKPESKIDFVGRAKFYECARASAEKSGIRKLKKNKWQSLIKKLIDRRALTLEIALEAM
jgi:hypothetical protein